MQLCWVSVSLQLKLIFEQMNKIFISLLTFIVVCLFASCNKVQTYAEQKKTELAAINKYLADSSVNVITEETFKAQNYQTNVARNEFVLLSGNGVYMQIVRNGVGEKIKAGETTKVLCRFWERNLLNDSIQLSNDVLYYSSLVDKMTVHNTSGTFTASFISGESVMASAYGSTVVPTGWLVPLSYINIGRPISEGDEIARVRLIVPHSSGQAYAQQNVYPCLYDITYQRGR